MPSAYLPNNLRGSFRSLNNHSNPISLTSIGARFCIPEKKSIEAPRLHISPTGRPRKKASENNSCFGQPNPKITKSLNMALTFDFQQTKSQAILELVALIGDITNILNYELKNSIIKESQFLELQQSLTDLRF